MKLAKHQKSIFWGNCPLRRCSQRKVVGTLWNSWGQDLIPYYDHQDLITFHIFPLFFFYHGRELGTSLFFHAFHMFFTAIIIPNNFTKNKQLAFQLNPTWISQRSSANMSDPKVTWPLPQVFSPPQICPIFRVLSISRTSPCTNDSSLARNNLWKMFKRRKNDPEICNNNKKRVDWHREWGYHNHKCTLDCIYSHHFVL